MHPIPQQRARIRDLRFRFASALAHVASLNTARDQQLARVACVSVARAVDSAEKSLSFMLRNPHSPPMTKHRAA